MKKIFHGAILFSLCVALLLTAGCTINLSVDQLKGSGTTKSQTYAIATDTVSSFELKDIVTITGGSGNVKIKLSPDGEKQMTITADDNILSDLTADTTNGMITVSGKKGRNYKSDDGITIAVTGVKFKNADFTVSGAATMEAGKCITGDSFHLTVNGTIDGRITLDVASGTVTLNGATKLALDGRADAMVLTVNGAGKSDCSALTCKDGSVTINGAGSASINASDTLNISLNGAGSVEYKGNPALTQKINGVGSVSRIE